ncbi:fascin-2 isoform X1 [Nannospalax galili]|uniref:fascin-2 isoform X1 n=2 Tax=Nannospalax galili TaxID=1026970 RepID=UPI00081A1622|nr:fascin-2 isoform X1 [Nannospalax galili]
MGGPRAGLPDPLGGGFQISNPEGSKSLSGFKSSPKRASPALASQERFERLHLFPPGVNVSANQDEELDHETFLMQIDQETKKCTFYSSTGGYWTLVTHGGIQATATQVSANTMFEMEWHGRRVALKAGNGRYICMKKNGQLAAISDFVGEDEEFILKLINRPILVLRGLDGFVCQRRGSNQLDTNRSTYDVFHLGFRDGAYQIRGRGGFWYTGSHGSVCGDGERAEDFLFEFRERGRLAIRALSGKYLRGGAAGLLRADADLPVGDALWEY